MSRAERGQKRVRMGTGKTRFRLETESVATIDVQCGICRSGLLLLLLILLKFAYAKHGRFVAAERRRQRQSVVAAVGC